MQEIPENAADTAHLAFLHGPAILSGSDLRYTKSRLWDFMKHVWKVAPRLPTWPHDVQSPPGQVAFLPLFLIPATFPPFRSHLFCISEPSGCTSSSCSALPSPFSHCLTVTSPAGQVAARAGAPQALLPHAAPAHSHHLWEAFPLVGPVSVSPAGTSCAP